MELTVDQFLPVRLHLPGQADQRELGGARLQGEHALPGKDPVHMDTVQSADKVLSFPDLDTPGPSEVVQPGIGLDHLGTEPGAFLVDPELAAMPDDLPERRVETDPVDSFVEQVPRRVGDMDLGREDDETVIGTVPQDGSLPEVEPGENAVGVGLHEDFRGQVAPDGYETVAVPLCRFRPPLRPSGSRTGFP